MFLSFSSLKSFKQTLFFIQKNTLLFLDFFMSLKQSHNIHSQKIRKQWTSDSARQENVTDSWTIKKKSTICTWKDESLLQFMTWEHIYIQNETKDLLIMRKFQNKTILWKTWLLKNESFQDQMINQISDIWTRIIRTL